MVRRELLVATSTFFTCVLLLVDAVSIVAIELDCVTLLPRGFHNRQYHGNNETWSGRRRKGSARLLVHGMEELFSRLLIVGQSRHINLAHCIRL